MKKDIQAMITCWRDPSDGSLPGLENDFEIFFDHHDEENRTTMIRDIRGSESEYSLDKHGFRVLTIPEKERDTTNEEIIKNEHF
jgi:hypothetical protein